MSEKITVRNTLNGQVAQVKREVMNNPHLAKHLVEVEDGAKPMNLSRPTTAEEFLSRRNPAPEPEPEEAFEFPTLETEKDY